MNELIKLQRYVEQKSSQRIKQMSALVDPLSVLYDIGCDHGLLGLYALFAQDLTKVYLVDESIHVISTLQQRLAPFLPLVPQVEVVHKRGEELTGIACNSTLVLSGMGYKTILRIIHKLLPQIQAAQASVVISSHSKVGEISQAFKTFDFILVAQSEVDENGQSYLIQKFRSKC